MEYGERMGCGMIRFLDLCSSRMLSLGEALFSLEPSSASLIQPALISGEGQ